MKLLEQTKILIRQSGLKPDRIKGQNFCVDEKVLSKMINAADLSSDDTVLEAGAGFGFLTAALVKKAKKVIAVELEPILAKVLKNLQAVNNNLEVIEGDVLKLANALGHYSVAAAESPALRCALGNDYKIVANLPYSITSVFLKKFLTAKNPPTDMTLLLQKEVAERISSVAGQMSLPAISVQLYAKPKIVGIFGPEAFWPRPAVKSAIIKIENIRPFPYLDISEAKFWQVVKSGFCSKRKTLQNNLSNSLHLPKPQVTQILAKVGLKNTVRAQELSLDDWRKLAGLL